MLAPKYEVAVTTYNRVMAHFTCITEYMCLFGSLWTLSFLKHEAIKKKN